MAYKITHVPKCVSRKFRKKRIMGEDQYIYIGGRQAFIKWLVILEKETYISRFNINPKLKNSIFSALSSGKDLQQ